MLLVKPDMALVHVRADLSGDDRYPGQTFRFRRTILLTNKDGGWRILAGQNAKLNDGIDWVVLSRVGRIRPFPHHKSSSRMKKSERGKGLVGHNSAAK